MFGEKKKSGYIRDIIASMVVIAFFTVIIIVYYNMLRDETESNVIKEGGLNAGISAEKLNGYLSVGMNCISLTGYTLDNMLLGERKAEILGYLVDQSFAVSNIMTESTTGVYGWLMANIWMVPDGSRTKIMCRQRDLGTCRQRQA